MHHSSLQVVRGGQTAPGLTGSFEKRRLNSKAVLLEMRTVPDDIPSSSAMTSFCSEVNLGFMVTFMEVSTIGVVLVNKTGRVTFEYLLLCLKNS